MARQPLPLGSYGQLKTWKTDAGYSAQVRFRDFDGVVRRVKRNGKTKAAATNALKEALTERETPVKAGQISRDTRFSVLAEQWLAEVQQMVDDGHRSPGTLDTYRSAYRNHVAPALDELRIREVTTPVVDRLLSAIKKASASRARTAKIVVSNVMRYGARQGVVMINPVREVARIESLPKNPPRALTEQERAAWLDGLNQSKRARDWDLPDLTLIMLATGARIGEALAIGWSEVDLEGGSVDIAFRMVRQSGVGLLRASSTKSGRKGERIIPLPGWALDVLKHRRQQIAAGIEPVFPDSKGGWRDRSNVGRVWRAERDALKMDGFVSHMLRKTVASYLDDANVSVRKISDQLGHSKVSMTQDRYLGRRITDRQTAEVLEDMFPPANSENSTKKTP